MLESTEFFSYAIATGLRYFPLGSQDDQIVSIAAVVDLIRTWFYLMTLRD